MKRKDYQKPTMNVVALKQQSPFLVGSEGVGATRSSYGTANSDVDPSEVNNTTGEWEWN